MALRSYARLLGFKAETQVSTLQHGQWEYNDSGKQRESQKPVMDLSAFAGLKTQILFLSLRTAIMA